jgi:hypothetical protein
VTHRQTLHYAIPAESYTLCGRFIYDSLSLRVTSDAGIMAKPSSNPCKSCTKILKAMPSGDVTSQ